MADAPPTAHPDDPSAAHASESSATRPEESSTTRPEESSSTRSTDSPSPLPDDVPRERVRRLADVPRDRSPLPDDAPFALCLTHDVDRPYKGLRALFYATMEPRRAPYHLGSALRSVDSSTNPYWQFDEIAALEDELGVRSAFYFLTEQHLLAERPPREWLSPTNWVQHLGRYDVTAPDVAAAIEELAAGGWEVGLHGSFHSARDRDRLREEKAGIEGVLGAPITGGRQHYLRLSVPETWRHHRAIGLRYDASLGSGLDCGFHYGYRPLRPFGDDFRVFPLTIMEQALPDPGADFERARDTCEELLLEAAANDAVMTALWHPRYFNEREFPGYRRCYRWLVERALELGGWVGSPRELVDAFDSVEETTERDGRSNVGDRSNDTERPTDDGRLGRPGHRTDSNEQSPGLD